MGPSFLVWTASMLKVLRENKSSKRSGFNVPIDLSHLAVIGL